MFPASGNAAAGTKFSWRGTTWGGCATPTLRVFGGKSQFLEKKLSANELEGFVNKENVVISHLWVGFA